MTSFRLRLLFFGFSATLLALIIAGFALVFLFERHLERRMVAEARSHLNSLIAGSVLTNTQELELEKQPIDPLFAKPYSGLYWQINVQDKPHLRSRSLWDYELKLPTKFEVSDTLRIFPLKGMNKTKLIGLERYVQFKSKDQFSPFRFVVAFDKATLTAAKNEFLTDLSLALFVLLFVLTLAFFWQVQMGLSPFKNIEAALLEIRLGKMARLPHSLPQEVLPLASEVNQLLELNEKQLVKAKGRAADLAHGLKTPLTALASDIRYLKQIGQIKIAIDIEKISEMMSRHIHRELTKSRASGRIVHGEPTNVTHCLAMICKTLSKTPKGERVFFHFLGQEILFLPITRADLEELFGNLLENALRHALSTVTIEIMNQKIIIEDDGAGLPLEQITKLRERGKRLDESQTGAGLGLAIVDDLLETLQGNIYFSKASIGGLRVEVDF
jgi:signal transduction histidine kinase